MRYEIRVNLNDENLTNEDALTAVVGCAWPYYDSADIDSGGVVTLEGSVIQPSLLNRIMGAIRMLNWGRVTIERTA